MRAPSRCGATTDLPAQPTRRSLALALGASMLVAAAACHEPTVPDGASIVAPDSPALAATANRKALNLRTTGNTSWSVAFEWDAVSGSASYRIRDNWGREVSVPGTQSTATWKYPDPPLNPGSRYSFSMYALDASGKKSSSSNSVTVTLPLDTQAPTVPTFSVAGVGSRHISLAWSSTDDSPWISYLVTRNGAQISSGWIADASKTFTLLQPGTTYTFTAQARDYFANVAGGNVSAVSAAFSVSTLPDDGSDVTPPTQPSPVFADLYGDGSTEMQLSWSASTDAVTPRDVIVYEVYVNGALENTVVGTTQASAYGVAGDNVITVVAIDEAGNRSVAGRTTLTIAF